MFTLFYLSTIVLSFHYCAPFVFAFTYSFGTLSECDDLPLTWNGGLPPFQLLIVPIFGTPVNISIPPSAFSNGVGSYSFQLPMANGSQAVFVMSDATGFNSGGSTDILTVQPSRGGSCNTNTTVDFSFQLNTALQQCRPYVFSGYIGALQPVKIGAIIPGGSAFALDPPTGPTSFTWNADVARGTSLIFYMTDSQGRQGGSSDVKVVGSSDDSSCLNRNSPTSTAGPPSSSTSSSSTVSSPSGPSSSAPAHSGVSIAAIAGTVIGALLFLAVVITLGLFFLRRSHDSGKQSNLSRQTRMLGSDIGIAYDPPMGAPRPNDGSAPFAGGPFHSPYPPSPSFTTPTSNPFLDAPPSEDDRPSHYAWQYQASESSYQNTDGYQPAPQPQMYPPRQNFPSSDPFNPSAPDMGHEMESDPLARQNRGESLSSGGSMTPSQRKATMAASVARYNPPTRFILHTDVEDVLSPDEEDVVELPPKYSERRGPLENVDPPAALPHSSRTSGAPPPP